jgi:hypothetical protein
MVNVTVKMMNLQELVRKTYLEGTINTAVIQFKDNRMFIEAVGIETEQGIVDGQLMVNVSYPCETMTEAGEIALSFIDDNKKMDILPKLELFERDDIVQLSVTGNELVVTRLNPPQVLTYELIDKKFVKSFSVGRKIVFGTPIKIVKIDGTSKDLVLDSTVVVDAQKLKEHGSKILKFKAKAIPITIKDGKLVTNVKGETSGFIREVDGIISVVGNANSTYNDVILKIFANGIGTATVKMSEGSPIHVSYTHESMTANFLLQIKDDKE